MPGTPVFDIPKNSADVKPKRSAAMLMVLNHNTMGKNTRDKEVWSISNRHWTSWKVQGATWISNHKTTFSETTIYQKRFLEV